MYPIGTILRKPCFLYYHVAVYIGNGLVLHNAVGGQEEAIPLERFLHGGKVIAENPGPFDVQSFLWRVQQILAAPLAYDLITNNCEHTVYRALFGVARSPQLAVFAGIVTGLGVAALFARAR